MSLAQLLSPRRQLALVFSDPGCGGCIEMLPELARIADEQADRLEVALVSTGDAEQNRARLDGVSLATVLLQDEHEVTVSYAARAMPSAVIVDSAGRIASALAIGGPRVIDLLGQAASGVADLELIEVGR